jgi:hypothetical protein
MSWGSHQLRRRRVGAGDGTWNELLARGDDTEDLLATTQPDGALRRFGEVVDIGK